MDARPEEAAKLAEAGVIDLIQLHGHETEAYLEELRELAQVPVIRAFSIREPADLEKAAASSADYFLLDNGAGGSGRAFDWGLLDDRGSCGRSGAAGHAEASVLGRLSDGKERRSCGNRWESAVFWPEALRRTMWKRRSGGSGPLRWI